MNQVHGFSFGSFVWWIGKVVNRVDDPLKMGRVRVRIYGYHPDDEGLVPDDHLPWAIVSQTTASAASKGFGISPTGLLEGSIVWGFFTDGENAQMPIVCGSLPGAPDGESDANYLATGENLDKTVISDKKSSVVRSGTSDGEWTEPETKASPKYPYNQVRYTESGHIEEFDDTEGAERYHRYHPSGSFVEVFPDGTQVEKIVKDNYKLVTGDDFVHIEGNVKVNVYGDSTLYIYGNAKAVVGGDMETQVSGDYTLRVGGKYEVTAGREIMMTAGRNFTARASRIDLN